MLFLKVNWPKSIILTILLVSTFFGLIFLKLFKYFRVLVFFSEVPYSEATYVFCETEDGIQDIEAIESEKDERFFTFKKLKYRLFGNKAIPVGFKYE
jgi:hypothetical protein